MGKKVAGEFEPSIPCLRSSCLAVWTLRQYGDVAVKFKQIIRIKFKGNFKSYFEGNFKAEFKGYI